MRKEIEEKARKEAEEKKQAEEKKEAEANRQKLLALAGQMEKANKAKAKAGKTGDAVAKMFGGTSFAHWGGGENMAVGILLLDVCLVWSHVFVLPCVWVEPSIG